MLVISRFNWSCPLLCIYNHACNIANRNRPIPGLFVLVGNMSGLYELNKQTEYKATSDIAIDFLFSLVSNAVKTFIQNKNIERWH